MPDSPKHTLRFLHNVRSIWRIASQSALETRHSSSPLVVHCSAGIGRSGQLASHLHRLFIAAGVFCAVYSTLVALPSIGKPEFLGIDVMGLVRKMREHRRYMVQTKAQYRFCYEAILQAARLYVDGSKKIKRVTESVGLNSHSNQHETQRRWWPARWTAILCTSTRS